MENGSFVPPLPKTSYSCGGPPNRGSCRASRWLQSAYPGASTSYLPIVAFQRSWIADGVGAAGQKSQPSVSNVRLCVRLKGTGVAVCWGGGFGVGVGDGAIGARGPPVGPAFASSPPQAARVEQAKTAVAQNKARRVCMIHEKKFAHLTFSCQPKRLRGADRTAHGEFAVVARIGGPDGSVEFPNNESIHARRPRAPRWVS